MAGEGATVAVDFTAMRQSGGGFPPPAHAMSRPSRGWCLSKTF
jgi:hypothetical protein